MHNMIYTEYFVEAETRGVHCSNKIKISVLLEAIRYRNSGDDACSKTKREPY